MLNKLLTTQDILEMSYTDFVGFVNQWNVLPGAYDTINRWIKYSNIEKKSRLIDVACTTGFTLREISKRTGCSGLGLDISKNSVEAANYNMKKYAPDIDVKYITQDSTSFVTDSMFSHVITASSLRFFSDPQKMLNNLTQLLEDKGKILVSEFYMIAKIPDELVENAKKIFNINITQIPYKQVMYTYRNFIKIYEDKFYPIEETEEELKHYTQSTIDKFYEENKWVDNSLSDVMYNRLYEIKQMSNKLRPYQGYNVMVLEYDKNIYPRRYTEIF